MPCLTNKHMGRGRRPKPSRVHLILLLRCLVFVAVASAWSPDAPWFLSATLFVCECDEGRDMRAASASSVSLSAYRIHTVHTLPTDSPNLHRRPHISL